MNPAAPAIPANPPDLGPDASIVYLNGAYLPLHEARVPVLDRGFIYGDGIYEVVPVYAGVPFRWSEHRARMRRSLGRIRLTDPLDDAGWEQVVGELIRRHPWPDQFLYLHITRGVARREHTFPAGVAPTVFAMSSPLNRPTAAVVDGGVAAITLPDERWLHCDIKSISLLGNVLARQAAADAGAFECLQFRDGWLTEGAAANIWVVQDGTVLGVPRNHLILEGIRYGLMHELCRDAGLTLTERPIGRDEVARADEILLTSATKEVLAITRLDGQPVADGRPGPVLKRLRTAYQRAIDASIATARGAA